MIAGFAFYFYPMRCHDVYLGVTPHFQATDARLPHWKEYQEGNCSACVLVDFGVNGLIAVTRQDVPPVPPAGWVCEDAALPPDWLVQLDGWEIRHISSERISGRTWCVFEACREPNGETCDQPEEPR